jgi:hypothetical protein
VNLADMRLHELSGIELPVGSLKASDLHKSVPEPSKLAAAMDGRVAVLLPGKKQPGQLASRVTELAMLPDRNAKRLVRCQHALCVGRHITDILWRPESNEIVFTATDHERGRAQSIHAWDVSTGNVRPVVVSDGLVAGSQRYWDIPCAVSPVVMVCVAAEADRPPRLEAIELQSGRRRSLYEPNRGLERDIAAIAPAEFMRWTDDQGREFTGHLFSARTEFGAPASPLFVNFYSCYGFLRGGLGDEWPLVSLAEQGISAMCINSIPEFPADFVARHDPGRAAIESIVRILSKAGRIDPRRVGMGGLSYGSEVALWTLANSSVVRAASVSSISLTPSYGLYYSLNPETGGKVRELWQLGSTEETLEQWRRISPAFHLERLHAPILFQQPESEYRLTLEYALPLVGRRQADLFVFPDEQHIKFQPRHKLAVNERNLDWFRFWLQGYEDPAQNKVEQYRLWREMRASEHVWGDASLGESRQ